jgi:hypothetical protein
MKRLPWALAALAALGLARLLPETGVGLWLRLLLATLVLLAPGALVARALRQAGPSAMLAWAFGGLTLALGFVFLVHTAVWVALLVLGAVALAALPFAVRRLPVLPPRGTVSVMLLGLVFGALLWHVAGSPGGDALFHLARVRKLDAFGGLHLRSVDEFRDGGLHPGYAFPLWHGFLALVGKVAGVDPTSVVVHEPSVLAPFAFGVVYEAGVRVFDSVAAGFAVLVAQVSLIAMAAGHGGSYVFLSLPPTASRQLLVPAVLALFFAANEGRRQGASNTVLLANLGAVAAGGLAIALIHPTYAVFLCLPLGGYVVARALLARRELLRGSVAWAALAAPTLAVALWVHSIAQTSTSLTPDDAERRRALRHYMTELDVFSLHRYRLAPEVLSRSGAVAVAALVLLPLAFLAAKRRWAALVLGGSLAVLCTVLLGFVFPHFADVVSLSQARRAAGFLPFAFAFAGGIAVLATLAGWIVLPAALCAGIGLQLAWPGDFGYGLREGGPAAAAWIALYGGAAALVFGVVWRRHVEPKGRGLVPLAALLFALPVIVHGFAHWSPRPMSHRYDLTPGLVRALQPLKGAVVYADSETSYRIAAYAPVYIAVAPPEHVADTRANRRQERIRDLRRFLRTGDMAIPRRYGADYLVLRFSQRPAPEPFVFYRDAKFWLASLRVPP